MVCIPNAFSWWEMKLPFTELSEGIPSVWCSRCTLCTLVGNQHLPVALNDLYFLHFCSKLSCREHLRRNAALFSHNPALHMSRQCSGLLFTQGASNNRCMNTNCSLRKTLKTVSFKPSWQSILRRKFTLWERCIPG